MMLGSVGASAGTASLATALRSSGAAQPSGDTSIGDEATESSAERAKEAAPPPPPPASSGRGQVLNISA